MRRTTFLPGRRFLVGIAVPLLLLLPACQQETGEEPVTTAEPVAESEPVAPPASNGEGQEQALAGETEASGESGETAYEPDISVIKAEELASKIDANAGKITVVNFWATWCPPCVKELPELVAFYEERDQEKVGFISVSVDHPDTVEDRVVPFVKERELPFAINVIDGMPDDIIDAMDVGDWTGAVPGTFIYDQEGKLVESWNQEITREDVEGAIEPLL